MGKSRLFYSPLKVRLLKVVVVRRRYRALIHPRNDVIEVRPHLRVMIHADRFFEEVARAGGCVRTRSAIIELSQRFLLVELGYFRRTLRRRLVIYLQLRLGAGEPLGSCPLLSLVVVLVKVLGQLALFFLNELNFISQVMPAAQLVGFVRQVSHGVRQILIECQKVYHSQP